MIWDSLSSWSFKITLYLDEKENKFLFVFRRRRASPQGFSKIKTTKQKKIHCTKSLPNRITLQTTSRTCLGRFHGNCWSTMDIHTMLVFEALRIKKIKTNKIKFGMMWLESLLHDYTIRGHSGFYWLILRMLAELTIFL